MRVHGSLIFYNEYKYYIIYRAQLFREFDIYYVSLEMTREMRK